MARPNVVVFGYDELLLASLEFIAQTRTRIAAVVFPSNRRDWRADKIRRIVSEKGLLTLEQPPKGEITEFTRKLQRIKPDLIYAWSYPMILPASIIKIPKYGSVNLHMGLLPEYRGVNGVRWALIRGEEKTGVTLHYMDKGVDSGDVIARASFPITAEDDLVSLMKKSKTAGLRLLETAWPPVVAGKARAVPQDESKANVFTAKMSAAADVIDWSKTNVEIHNLIRASVSPYPGVYTFFNGKKLVVRKSVPAESDEKQTAAGTIGKIDADGIEVTTGRGNLLLTHIEFEEKPIKPTVFEDFGLMAGRRFENS